MSCEPSECDQIANIMRDVQRKLIVHKQLAFYDDKSQGVASFGGAAEPSSSLDGCTDMLDNDGTIGYPTSKRITLGNFPQPSPPPPGFLPTAIAPASAR